MAEFIELALPFIPYRIPMFPLRARPADGKGNPQAAKQPWQGLGGWQFKATSDPYELARMNSDICRQQDANCALVAKAERGGFCFWEFDAMTIEQACAEAGQPRPVTLEQRSGRGGCHLVFRHTPRSIELGNRSARDSGGHELWSFRADNRYIVAAGSTHPNGRLYELVRNCRPVPVPDWVVDYIAGRGSAERPKPKNDGGPRLDAGFDFDEFLDHYSLAIDGREADGWNTLSECPAAGRRHEGNGTAIYHDGESLRWSCLAGGCELNGKTMGEVIRWLNTEGGFEPYPGPVWQAQSEDELLEAMGVVNAYADTEPEKAEAADSPGDEDVIAMLKSKATAEAPDAEEPKPVPQPPPAPREPEPAPPAPGESRPPDLEFPEEALYGRLGELARGMRMPLGLAYPALLTCYSVVPNTDEMCGVRINLYTALIARKGGGKNTAIKRAKESLGIGPDICSKFAAGGDTQLCVALGDRPRRRKGKGSDDGENRAPGPGKMLLLNNEISEMLKKSGIDASTLADRLCDFYDDNEFQKMVRGEMVKVNCRISWLGGVPATVEEPDRFRELFGASTNDGLYERFIFGYEGRRRFKYRRWEPPCPPPDRWDLEPEEELSMENFGCTLVRSIHPDAEALKDEWVSPREEREGSTRLEFLLLKVAVLTASANDEKEVSVPCMRAAIAFLEWQDRLKEVFQVGMAKNLEAEFDAMAVDAIQRLNEKNGGYAKWRRLSHDRKWNDRYGASNVGRWMEALMESGSLVFHMYRDEQGKVQKDKRKVMTFEYARKLRRERESQNGKTEA